MNRKFKIEDNMSFVELPGTDIFFITIAQKMGSDVEKLYEYITGIDDGGVKIMKLETTRHIDAVLQSRQESARQAVRLGADIRLDDTVQIDGVGVGMCREPLEL
jgi:hypothetical protein